MHNMRWNYLQQVPVCQDRGGLHEGRIWKPRAATFDVTQNPMDLQKVTNPGNLDGDHVLVGFIEDTLNQPIVLAGIPHPAVDQGNNERIVGGRFRLKLADGDPDFRKHHGSFFGVDSNGNWVTDTRWAHDGTYQPDGTEPDPPTDGKGSQYYRLPADAEQVTEILDAAAAQDQNTPVALVTETLDKTQQKLDVVDGDDNPLLVNTQTWDRETRVWTTAGGEPLVNQELDKDHALLELEGDLATEQLTQASFRREIKDQVVWEQTQDHCLLELEVDKATQELTQAAFTRNIKDQVYQELTQDHALLALATDASVEELTQDAFTRTIKDKVNQEIDENHRLTELATDAVVEDLSQDSYALTIKDKVALVMDASEYNLDIGGGTVLVVLSATSLIREIAGAVKEELSASVFQVDIGGGLSLKVEGSEAGAKLTIGDGAKSVLIAEAWETFWDSQVKPKFDAFDSHTHSAAMGATGPPSGTVALPSYSASSATSGKVKFPAG